MSLAGKKKLSLCSTYFLLEAKQSCISGSFIFPLMFTRSAIPIVWVVSFLRQPAGFVTEIGPLMSFPSITRLTRPCVTPLSYKTFFLIPVLPSAILQCESCNQSSPWHWRVSNLLAEMRHALLLSPRRGTTSKLPQEDVLVNEMHVAPSVLRIFTLNNPEMKLRK